MTSADENPTTPIADSTPASQTPAAPKSRRRFHPALIGAGAAVAVLLVAGGGVAIGATLGDRDDDAASGQQVVSSGQQVSSSSDATDDAAQSAQQPAATETVSSDDFAVAIAAAVAAADGTGATSIDREDGGFEIDVLVADGREVEVFVDANGAARVVDDRDDDADGDPAIDVAALSEIFTAAVDAAGGGSVDAISTDDRGARYDVQVAQSTSGGDDIEVELDEALAVIAVDRD